MTVPMHDELILKVGDMDWVPMIEGISFKLLRISPETGAWTVMLNCDKGSTFPAHKHFGAGEYYVVKGKMTYRAGSAETGDFGYEPIGVIHEGTTFVEATELLFTNHGPVIFLNEDGSFGDAMDYTTVYDIAHEYGAV